MLEEFKKFYDTLNGWHIFGIVVLILVLSGPILFLIFKMCQFVFFIIKFNFNFLMNNFNLFPKEKTKDSESTKTSNISINNSPPTPNANLSLIELKMIELKQREYNNKNQQLQQNNLLQLELNQKLHQNKMEEKFELYKLEQKIVSLEKEIQRLSGNNNFQNKNNTGETNDHLPETLKEIFDKISDFENVQLFMLNKMINNENKSYYDSHKNALYINPQDLNFVKNFLVNKQKENKRFN